MVGKPKNGKKEARPLLRPIICICNDMCVHPHGRACTQLIKVGRYAPVLRPLRPLCRVVRFAAPAQAALIQRLRGICDGEALSSDTKSLTSLVTLAEGDMRTCLNTLQVSGFTLVRLHGRLELKFGHSSSRREAQLLMRRQFGHLLSV